MAFPSSQGTKPQTLAQVLALVTSYAGNIKSLSMQLNTKSASTDTPAYEVRDYVTQVAAIRATMVGLAATPGLAVYAQEQYNDGALNIQTEWASMLAQIDATIAWIVANFPKAASSELLVEKLNANGTIAHNAFTPAQLAGLRTQLQSLIATIN